jgi:alanyl-tRNA synthetase
MRSRELNAKELRQAYIDFFVSKGHAQIPRAQLIPKEDPTTLFTGSGMQPLIGYLLGQDHPLGDRLVNSQPCLRVEDIDEVGDSRHSTFFEMLGNWSLGSYFKKDEINWLFEFFVEVIGLDPNHLYVTVFNGSREYNIEKDSESADMWAGLFAEKNIEPVISTDPFNERGRIYYYDESKCWWSRSGPPSFMPEGEPGGPDTEVFFEFTDTNHDQRFGPKCHPHCDCGRYVEIGNSVFMQYIKKNGIFEPLYKKNVDYGGGLERLSMASNLISDVFKIDLFSPIIKTIEQLSLKTYEEYKTPMRIIADHIRALVFLAADGLIPSNTAQGYVMRRLQRRVMRQAMILDIKGPIFEKLTDAVIESYDSAYGELEQNADSIKEVLNREEELFNRTLKNGLREFQKLSSDGLDGKKIFKLFDTYGFPPEITLEEAERLGIKTDPNWKAVYQTEMNAQKQRSKTAAQGLFKGGLADHSEETTKLHTATHLLYKALRIVLGDHVIQRGSNITAERLRFDFSHPQKLTPEELKAIEDIVNENINKDWPVTYEEMSPDEAFSQGALGAFGDKYGEIVKVYTAGDPKGVWYSKEICGGPHVTHTGVLGRFRIVKEESSSAGVRRIKAVLE